MANEPSMTEIIANVEQQISQNPQAPIKGETLDKFVPPKYRNADTLESIQNDVRKALVELENQRRRLEEYCLQLKQTTDDMKRLLG